MQLRHTPRTVPGTEICACLVLAGGGDGQAREARADEQADHRYYERTEP